MGLGKRDGVCLHQPILHVEQAPMPTLTIHFRLQMLPLHAHIYHAVFYLSIAGNG